MPTKSHGTVTSPQSSLITKSIQTLLAASVLVTSAAPASAASGVYFRFKQPAEWVDGIQVNMPPENPGVVITPPGDNTGSEGNPTVVGAPKEVDAVTKRLLLTAEIDEPFEGKIFDEMTDVVRWEHDIEKGEFPNGLSLNEANGTITGTPIETTEQPKLTQLNGYNADGQVIVRASVSVHVLELSPDIIRNQQIIYAHTDQYIEQDINTDSDGVSHWEAATPLPDGLKIEHGIIKGAATEPYTSHIALIGYDHLNRQVAATYLSLTIDEGLELNKIADKMLDIGERYEFFAKVKRSVGAVTYELVDLEDFEGVVEINPSSGLFKANIPFADTEQRFQIKATDVDGTVGYSNIFTLYTEEAQINISELDKLVGTQSRPYKRKIYANNIEGTANWSVLEGSLPPGIQLDPNSGILSGTPTEAGKYEDIVIGVASTSGQSAQSRQFTFTIQANSLYTYFNTIYARENTLFEGRPLYVNNSLVEPAKLSLVNDTLPTALSDVIPNVENRSVSGTVAKNGRYSLPFIFENGDGRKRRVAQPFRVGYELSASSPTNLTFTRTKYSSQRSIVTENERGIITATISPESESALPEGLILSKGGFIKGIPTTVGTHTGIIVNVTDERNGNTNSTPLTITVVDRPEISLKTNRDTISWQRKFSSGRSIFSIRNAINGAKYRLVSGTLPEGVSLREDGYLYGQTAVAPGLYPDLQVQVTDGEGYTALSNTFTIEVTEPNNLLKSKGMDKDGLTVVEWTVGKDMDIAIPVSSNAELPVQIEERKTEASEPVSAPRMKTMSLMSAAPLADMPMTMADVEDASSEAQLKIIDGKLIGNIPDVGTYNVPYTLTDAIGRKLQGTIELRIKQPISIKMPENKYLTTFTDADGDTVYQYDVPRYSVVSIKPTIENGVGRNVLKYSYGKITNSFPIYDHAIRVSSSAIGRTTGISTATATDASGASSTVKFIINTVERTAAELTYDLPEEGLLVTANQSAIPVIGTLDGASSPARFNATGLPYGLSVGYYSGTIYGTATTPGIYKNVKITAQPQSNYDWIATYGPFTIMVMPSGDITVPATTIIQTHHNTPFETTIKPGNTLGAVNFYSSPDDPLIEGVKVDNATGVISGTVSKSGLTNAGSVEIVDAAGRRAVAPIVINDVGSIEVTPPVGLDNLVHKQAVNATPSIKNTVGKVRYSIAEMSKKLPSGLEVNYYTGAINGYANAEGTYDGIIIKATDSTGAVGYSKPFTVAITQRAPLSAYVSSTLVFPSDKWVGVNIHSRNAIGTPEISVAGKLPKGLTFNSALRRLEGTVTEIGEFPIDITIRDSVERTGITQRFVVTGTAVGSPYFAYTLPKGVEHRDYASEAPTVKNIIGKAQFSASQELAANGFKIDAETGVISSVNAPAGALSFDAVVYIKDQAGRTSSATIKIQILGPLQVSFSDLYETTYGTSVTNTSPAAIVSNADGKVSGSIIGQLPMGMSFNSTTLKFRYTATELGEFPVTIKVTEIGGANRTAEVNTTIKVLTDGKTPTVSFAIPNKGFSFKDNISIKALITNAKTGTVVELAPDSAPLPPGVSLLKKDGNYYLTRSGGAANDIGIYEGIKFKIWSPDGLSSETPSYTFVILGSLAFETVKSSRLSAWESVTLTPKQVVTADNRILGKLIYSIDSFDSKYTKSMLTLNEETGALTASVPSSGTVRINYKELSPIDNSTVMRSGVIRYDFDVASTTLTGPSTINAIENLPIADALQPILSNPAPDYTMTFTKAPKGLYFDKETGKIEGAPTELGTLTGSILQYYDGHTRLEKGFTFNVARQEKDGRGFKYIKFTNPGPNPTNINYFRMSARATDSSYSRIDDYLSFNEAMSADDINNLRSGNPYFYTLMPGQEILAELPIPLQYLSVMIAPTSALNAEVSDDGINWRAPLALRVGSNHTTNFQWWDPEEFAFVEENVERSAYSGINAQPFTMADYVDLSTIKAGSSVNDISWTWAIHPESTSKSLPSGLSINKTTGVVSGKPTVAGTYKIIVTGTLNYAPITALLTLNIKPGSADIISFNNSELSAGQLNQDFNYDLKNEVVTVIDGDVSVSDVNFITTRDNYNEITDNLVDGEKYGIPPGLQLNIDGTISGTAKAAGTYIFGVRATHAANTSFRKTGIVKISILGGKDVVGKYVELSVGVNNTCGITTADTIECWGRQNNFMLGNGDSATGFDATSPVVVEGTPSNAKPTSISVGATHACASFDNGAAYCWGDNQYVLTSGASPYAIPVMNLGAGSGIKSISVGSNNACVLKSDGLWCWGYNDFFKTTASSASTIASLQRGESTSLGTVTKVAMGPSFTCYVRSTGTSNCVGLRTAGRLGDGIASDSRQSNRSAVPDAFKNLNIKDITAFDEGACALDVNNDVYCWGYSGSYQASAYSTAITTPVKIPNLPNNIKQITSGAGHNCALTTTGDLYCWGRGTSGQTGNPAGASSQKTPYFISSLAGMVKKVSAGGLNTCAILMDDSKTCWGVNSRGQVGNGIIGPLVLGPEL